jgi:hypothetical protein
LHEGETIREALLEDGGVERLVPEVGAIGRALRAEGLANGGEEKKDAAAILQYANV